MRIFKLLFLPLGLLLALGACSSSNIEQIEDDFAANAGCGITEVSYATDIVPILTMYCTPDFNGSPNFACHGAGAVIGDWTDYNSVKAVGEAGNLMTEINAGSMPPGNTTGPENLDPCEIEQLQFWLDAGAPDN